MGDDAPAHNATVVASDITRANFPIIDRLPEWANEDLRTLIVLSPEDLSDPEIEELKTIERGYKNAETTVSQYNQMIAESNANPAEALRSYLEKNHQEVFGHIRERDLADLSDVLVKGEASALTIDTDVTEQDRFIIILVTPYVDASKEELAAGFTDLELDEIENLPGTDMDWRNAFLAHEVGHGIEVSPNKLSEEIIADLNIYEVWRDEFNVSSNGTDQVPDAYQAMRAIRSFWGNSGSSHLVNAAIRSEGEGPAPKGSETEFINQLWEAQNLVSHKLGFETLRIGRYTDIATNLIIGEPPLPDWPVHVIGKEDETVLMKMIAEPGFFYEHMNALSDETTSVLNDAIRLVDTQKGRIQGIANQPLFYEKAFELYQGGEFDHIPIGKQYVYEFLVAANRYAPNAFETASYDIETLIAPVFDEEGRHIEQATAIQPGSQ